MLDAIVHSVCNINVVCAVGIISLNSGLFVDSSRSGQHAGVGRPVVEQSWLSC